MDINTPITSEDRGGAAAPAGSSHGSHGSHGSSGGGGGHSTIFNTVLSTSIFSERFTPKTRGGYAGAIIFLIVFTVVYRGLAAWGGILERKYARRERNRVVV